MEPGRTEIDEPLGLDGPPQRPSGWRRAGAAVLIFCAVAAIGGVGAIAWDGWRVSTPPSVAVSALRTAPAKPAELAEAEPVLPTAESTSVRPSPSIIRVDPAEPPAGENVIVIRDPSSHGQNPRVAHLPDRALIEHSELGPLPARGAGGRRPFDAYARPWSGARGARIAIVIGGLGISQTGTQEAIEKLPPEITLAFAPLGNSLSRWMQTARRDGHEIIMQVPLEPIGYPASNPGRYTLLTGADPDTNLVNLHRVLARITNYTGVMNYMGARFTSDPEAMDLLMGELAQRGLLYVDDGSSARSLAEQVALAKGVPFAASDEIIDQERERGAILAKLDELERIARARGFAVGSGSALEATVETVSAWADEVRKRGIELVPISAVAFDPERS
ncbi:divergent polysaccharide deacetylase family protein [Chelativorans sp.]|uniref:divergent polysaccharide deacetylase family protein n=1 Tax=Chelativorans sp. TaxID=2203393 RepID=UPI002811038D|nr:divergent polysaccharide deacetylase family protein [Chelativorans sp.]